MAVKVLISRRFKEGQNKKIFALLNNLRIEAMNQAGYISGETLVGHDNPNHMMVISTWASVDNWLAWKENPGRKANEEKIQPFLDGPTEYELFSLGTYPTPR